MAEKRHYSSRGVVLLPTPFFLGSNQIQKPPWCRNQKVRVLVQAITLLLFAPAADEQRRANAVLTRSELLDLVFDLDGEFLARNQHQNNKILVEMSGFELEVRESDRSGYVIHEKKGERNEISECLSTACRALENNVAVTEDAGDLISNSAMEKTTDSI